MRTMLFTLALGAFGGTYGFAFQQGGRGPGNPAEVLLRLDANNDKVIETSEVPEDGKAAFAKLLRRGDANSNEKLEIEEVRDLLRKLRGPGAGRPEDARRRFAEQDSNQDGKLARDEFKGPAPLFDRLDADKDGFIDREESIRGFVGAGGPPPLAGAMFERLEAMDANKDGRLSRDEFKGPAPLFDRLDANKDGAVTLDELRRPRTPGSPSPDAPKPANGDSAPAGHDSPSRRADRAVNPRLERLRALDTDKDGKYSREELSRRPELFDRLDRNADGFITREELEVLKPRGGDAPKKKAEKTA